MSRQPARKAIMYSDQRFLFFAVALATLELIHAHYLASLFLCSLSPSYPWRDGISTIVGWRVVRRKFFQFLKTCASSKSRVTTECYSPRNMIPVFQLHFVPGPLAQSAERGADNAKVVSSTLTRTTDIFFPLPFTIGEILFPKRLLNTRIFSSDQRWAE